MKYDCKKEKSRQEKLGQGVGFERIRRITGYLVGTMDKWNDAKRAEERDRVKHGLGRPCLTWRGLPGTASWTARASAPPSSPRAAPHHCPGCHNPETWPFEGAPPMEEEALLALVRENPCAGGVTFSGGALRPGRGLRPAGGAAPGGGLRGGRLQRIHL